MLDRAMDPMMKSRHLKMLLGPEAVNLTKCIKFIVTFFLLKTRKKFKKVHINNLIY